MFGFPNMALDLLVLIFGVRCSRRFRRAADQYKMFCKHLMHNHGPVMATKILKTVYGQAKRVAFGFRNECLMYPIWLHSDSNSMPRKLRFLNKLLSGRSRINRLFALSVYATYLGIRHRPVVKLDSILRHSTYKVSEGLILFIRDIFAPDIKAILTKRKWELRFPKDLFLVKSDPYRTPSLTGSVISAAVLVALYDLKDRSAVACVRLGEFLLRGKSSFLNRLRKLAETADLRSIHQPERLMALFAAPDRGGKTRVMTSGCYWFQYVLYPIHDLFMRVLRTLPEDFTYKQDKAVEWVQLQHSLKRRTYSFDMTDATDRFPLHPQRFFLSCMFGNRIASYWSDIVTGEVYCGYSRKGCPNLYEKGLYHSPFVRFNSGQPMGIYSSWPTFALLHHAVVRYSFFVHGLSYRNRYAVLGDDVVIAHDKAAWTYHSLLTKSLGCDISLQKSYIPHGTYIPCEFAKKLVLNGVILTPLTPDLLESSFTLNWTNVQEILQHVVTGWNLKLHRNYLSPPRFKHLFPSKKDMFKAMATCLTPGVPYFNRLDQSSKDFGMFCLKQIHVPVSLRHVIHETFILIKPETPEEALLRRLRTVENFSKQLKAMRLRKVMQSYVGYVRQQLTLDLGSLTRCQDDMQMISYFDKYQMYHPLTRVILRLYWKVDVRRGYPDPETPLAILRGLESAIRFLKPSWRSRVGQVQRIRDLTRLSALAWAKTYAAHQIFRLHP